MTDNIKLPTMPKPHTPPVFATAANTLSVKAGYELGGYEKTPPLFDEHQLEAYAREAVRLNAQALPAAPQQPLTDEKEALDLLNAENARLTKLVIELRAEVVRLNAQAVPDEWEREIWRKKLENLISEYGGERATEAYHGGHFCKRNPTAIRKEISAMLSDAPAAPQPAQPTSNHRPDRQWYARMIQETLDDDFAIGPAFDEKVKEEAPAPAAPQPAQQEPTLDDPNMHEYGTHNAEITERILRDVCELDPANPALNDTLCVDISDLKIIVDRALADIPPHIASQQERKPLTDQQCDAIYMALDNWAREFDAYEFGLPHSCGGGVEGGREIIRNAISGVKP